MFKRLFIGLIILSALAAEGIMNIPGNVYDFLSCLQIGADATPDRTQLEAAQNVREVAAQSNQAFLLTLGSIQKLRGDFSRPGPIKKEAVGQAELNPEFEKSFSYNHLYIKPLSNQSGKSILYHSDSSPPVL